MCSTHLREANAIHIVYQPQTGIGLEILDLLQEVNRQNEFEEKSLQQIFAGFIDSSFPFLFV